MKMKFIFFLIMSFIGIQECLMAQNIIRLKGDRLPIVCYAENNNTIQSRIDAPILKNAAGRIKTSTIEVEYFGFTTEAQAAFENAVSIWEGLISSPVKIRVAAVWTNLPAGVLGSAGPSFWASNFDGAPNYNVYYPGALAEKLARTNLNSAQDYDIVAQFNSSANWYFQPTGTPGDAQHDFITVVLHELGHGLGFTSTFTEENGLGLYGPYTDGIPFVFDVAVQNATAQNLYHNFDSPSAQMASQLTSDNIFFDSPTNGSPARLYAPSPFNDGSSIAHLDAATFPQGNINSLMRPFINTKEVNHNPGAIVENIFKDLGWVTTYIDHAHIKDSENLSAPIVLKTVVKADETPGYSYDSSQLYLVYTTSSNAIPTEVLMTSTGTANEFSVTLPAPGSPETYTYFIKVKDSYNRMLLNPGKYYAPLESVGNKGPVDAKYSFHVGPDTQDPILTHTPKSFISYLETALVIDVEVRESSGLSSVQLESIFNNGTPQVSSMDLVDSKQDAFSGTTIYHYRKSIPFTPGQLNDGDAIKYMITARDNAVNKNDTTIGYFIVPVEGLAPARTYYLNNFNTLSDDFIGEDFSIATPDGFSNPAIHSVHPYPEAGNADALDLTYQLRIPIIVGGEESMMHFDEIVLVEPGENGTTFEDENFFDYAIVEGSKDGGVTWIPLIDGYDSRDYNPWLIRYSSVTNTGDASLFRERAINLRNTFSAGDEIVIRFRIHSDPFQNAWGWAIDNLQIQVDNVPPVIQHNHLDYVRENTATLTIPVSVTDDLQLDTLTLQYKINEQSPETEGVSLDGTTSLADFSFDISTLQPGDVIYYKIEAADSAGNVTRLPAEDYFVVPVLSFNETVSQYTNDFNNPTNDFAGNFFEIEQVSGFENGAIHTKHPYLTGFGLNNESDFTFTLKKKIKINAANPYVQFDEVCLAEGHEASAVFGTSGFNDFVIVEASADEGTTWQPLVEGYDVTEQSTWQNAAANHLDGSETLFKRKTINVLDNEDLAAGDTVLIRFRLFSNETIATWGWAIDNLHIQDIVTGTETAVIPSGFSVYPNPVKDNSITLEFNPQNSTPVSVSILNAQGMVMDMQKIDVNGAKKISHQIDLHGYADGIYVICLSMNAKTVTRKFILAR